MKSCDTDHGFKYDDHYKKCVKISCPEGFLYDSESKLCKKVYCKNGYVLEMKT